MGGTPVRILLARHGETVFNVEGRWQGQADSPLTDRGRAQAAELARALADEQIAAVYSSDLGRAANTASEVASLHQLPVTTEARLREIHVGAWTGKNREEIDLDYPGGRKAWATQPSAYQLPGGETIGPRRVARSSSSNSACPRTLARPWWSSRTVRSARRSW